jgi:hypothetical protein
MQKSMAALDVYTLFSRLFLRLLEEYPELKQTIDQKVLNMMDSDQDRNK